MNIVYYRCGILCVDLPLACACVSASLVGMYVCKCLAKMDNSYIHNVTLLHTILTSYNNHTGHLGNITHVIKQRI